MLAYQLKSFLLRKLWGFTWLHRKDLMRASGVQLQSYGLVNLDQQAKTDVIYLDLEDGTPS